MERKVRTASNIEVTYESLSGDQVRIIGIVVSGKSVCKANYMVSHIHPGGYGSVPHKTTHNSCVKVGMEYHRNYFFSHDAVELVA